MSFRENHPYLFWELIGLAILLLDGVFTFIAAWFELFCDTVYMAIVLTAVAAGAIILVSPALIFVLRRKNGEAQLDNTAIQLCSTSRKYRWQTIFVCFFSVFLFLAVAGVCLYFGLPILVPLGIYPAAIVYIPWTRYMLRKFYGDNDAVKHCERIFVNNTAFLSSLNADTALSSPEPKFGNFSDTCLSISGGYTVKYLNFLYSFLRFEGMLRSDTLRLYILDIKCVNESLGISLNEEETYLWCIPAGELSGRCKKQRLIKARLCPLSVVIDVTLAMQQGCDPFGEEYDEDEYEDGCEDEYWGE